MLGVRNWRFTMQREARITSKGQITVPKAVRNALGLKPGDKVVFEQEVKRSVSAG